MAFYCTQSTQSFNTTLDSHPPRTSAQTWQFSEQKLCRMRCPAAYACRQPAARPPAARARSAKALATAARFGSRSGLSKRPGGQQGRGGQVARRAIPLASCWRPSYEPCQPPWQEMRGGEGRRGRGRLAPSTPAHPAHHLHLPAHGQSRATAARQASQAAGGVPQTPGGRAPLASMAVFWIFT